MLFLGRLHRSLDQAISSQKAFAAQPFVFEPDLLPLHSALVAEPEMLSKPIRAPAEPKGQRPKGVASPSHGAETPHEAAPPNVAAPPHSEMRQRAGRGPGSAHSEPTGAFPMPKGAGKGVAPGMWNAPGTTGPMWPGPMWHQDNFGNYWMHDGKNWWCSNMAASGTSTGNFGSWSFVSQATQQAPHQGPHPAEHPNPKSSPKSDHKPPKDKKDKDEKKEDKQEKKADKNEKEKKASKKAKDEPPDDDPPDWNPEDDEFSDYTYEEESEESEEEEPDESVPVTPRSDAFSLGFGQRPNEAHQADARPARRRRPRGGSEPSGPPSLPSGSRRSQPASSRSSQVSTMRTASLRDMLRQRGVTGGERMKANLGQVRLETFSGNRAEYKNWLKTIQAQKELYQIQDKELAVLLFLSCQGEARDVLNQLEVQDLQAEGGLQRALRLLEDAFGAKSDERFEDRQNAYFSCRRLPGQSIAAYLSNLKRLRTEYLKEDPQSVISDKSFAQRMLSRAALTRKERYDVFFAAGGSYRSGPLEKVLRFRCANVHLDERPGRARDEKPNPVHRPPFRRKQPMRRTDRRAPYRPTRHTHVADQDEDYEGYDDEDEDEGCPTDEEDLEQEAMMADEDYYEDDQDEGYTEDEEEIEDISQEDLREAYAAGWKARQQTAQARQSRGYKGGGKKGKGKGKRQESRNPDDRKKNSTCASCLQKGHWKGDAVCPNVKSGRDKPHHKAENSSMWATSSRPSRPSSGSRDKPKPKETFHTDTKKESRDPLPRRRSSNKDSAAPVNEKEWERPYGIVLKSRPVKKDAEDIGLFVKAKARKKPDIRDTRRPNEPDHPPPLRPREPDHPPPNRPREPDHPPPSPPRKGNKVKKEKGQTSGSAPLHPPTEDEPRKKKRRHKKRAKAEDEASVGTAETPRDERSGVAAFLGEGSSERQVNWTLMVGGSGSTGWERVRGYHSEDEDYLSGLDTEESEEEDLVKKYNLGTPKEFGHPGIEPKSEKAKEKLRVKLRTILQSLEKDEEDEKVRQRLQKKGQRLLERSTRHAARGSASASGSDTAPKKKTGRKPSPEVDDDMGLTTHDLLAILPAMSKEEKKILYKQLRREKEDEALKLFGRGIGVTPSKLQRPDKRNSGYSAASVPSLAQGSRLSKENVAEPPDMEENIPIGVRKKRMEKFRQELYEAAKNRKGKVIPSDSSDLPTAEQEACPHPFNRLVWGANAHCHWASCKDCRLRKVLYYSVLHGAMTVSQDQVSDVMRQARRHGTDHHQVYQSHGLTPGHVILDTGCRTAVAGRMWHNQLQKLLDEKNMVYHKTFHEEIFRFGAGAPVLSTEAYIYPIQIYDHKSWVRIAVVDNTQYDDRVAECPGLVGPAELTRWKVQIDFSKLQIGIHGQWQPTVLSSSRHPILNLLNMGHAPRYEDWERGELGVLRQRLAEDPHSFALMQEVLEVMSSDSGSADEMAYQEEIHWNEQEIDKMANWQKKTESEAINLLDNIGMNCFRATNRPLEEEGSDGSISERESETSHEAGLPMALESSDEESTETEEEETRDEVFIAGSAGDTEILTKGQKRRLLAATKNISEAVDIEQNQRQEKEVPRIRRLKTGFKILELFTWSCMLSRFAYGLGWEYLEPLTLPGWDCSKPQVQMEAFQYLERTNPDFVMIAWPCGPWSVMQNANQRTWTQRESLRRKRLESRKLLRFASAVALHRQRRGKAILGENPLLSRAWHEPPIVDGFGHLPQGICDQCQYGLKHPENGMPLKKSTRFSGQEEIVAQLRQRCPGHHEHHPIEGSVRTDQFGTISLSAWAGGYPIPLCRAIMRGVLEFLHRPAAPGHKTYVLEDELREESYQDGMEGIEEEEKQIAEDNKKLAVAEDERHPVSMEIQRAVEFAHRQLGHPSRDTLVRMLKLSGANADAIRHARHWQCDVCKMRVIPKHPMATTPTLRPFGFNRKIHVDIKFVFDSRGAKYPALSVVDLGTVYHAACMLKTRRSDYVASKFLRLWIQPFGPPEHITHDQGGEFELVFTQLLEQMAVPSSVTGAHAGWQLSVGERHGHILGNMISAITAEHMSEGFSAMKLVLSSAVSAKNMTITKDGFSPNQRLFGSDVKYPNLTEENVKPSFAESLDTETEFARAHRMRTCARLALIRMDVKEKVRRAILRKPTPTVEGPFLPGTQVYFWNPKRTSRRYVRGGVWRGPATILTRESQERYFASWRGRALLLAAPNIRLATKEELALNEPAKADAEGLGEILRDPLRENSYKDQSRIGPPPKPRKRKPFEDTPERKRARMMLKGSKSIRQIFKDFRQGQFQLKKRPKMIGDKEGEVKRQKSAVAAPPASLPLQLPAPPPRGEEPITVPDDSDRSLEPVPTTPAKTPPGYYDEQVQADPEELPHIDTDDEGLAEPSSTRAAPPTAIRPEDVPVPPMEDDDWEAELQERIRAEALDDVPIPIKRKFGTMNDDQADQAVKKLRSNFCMQVAVTTLFGELQNEWVSKYEVELLRQLTGLPVTAARIHRSPRKRFQRPPKMVSRSRLSILIGEDPKDTYIVNETSEDVDHNPRRRSPMWWKGMTIFYKTVNEPQKEKVFVEMPDGIYQTDLTADEYQEFTSMYTEEVRDILTAEVLLLKMKQGGKELDPKYFDAKEKEAFEKSDMKEWSEWIKNSVIRRVPKEEAAKIPRSSIFRAPLRMLRVNKESNKLLPLVAKSRLIVPGHLDPQLGQFRTDSPTVPQAAVRAAKAIAAARKWQGTTFDVTTAFLSGKSLSRRVFVRAPAEGLPSAMDWPKISPFELMQILKSAYGLTESPRLWYLEAVERLKSTELKELEMSRSTFVAGGGNGEPTWAMLCLHVDDGLLLGDFADPRFQKLRKQINGLFTIKAWKDLSPKEPIQFLGVDVTQDDAGIHDDMAKYIKQIKVEELHGSGPLNPREVTLYRQLVMRLRWPAQQVMPHLLYEVSSLAQRVNRATHADYKEAVKLHQKFLEESNQGRAQITYPPLREKDKLFYVSYFDASVGREEDGKSQLGAIHFLTTECVKEGPTPASVVEFSTNKSIRVLRSSMSAESCSMSIAVDKHLYGRLVLDCLLYGLREIKDDWRITMKVKGGAVTDAKSLYDHLSTTGQLPTERQTLLDLLVCRHHLESEAYELFWVPTHRQHADGLTKKMVNLLWQAFCRKPMISLRESPEEKELEDHRRKLRQGQRLRRKEKMKGRVPKASAAPKAGIQANKPTLSFGSVKK